MTFEGAYESQDSQALWEAYRAEFVVGNINHSPPPGSAYLEEGNVIPRTQAAVTVSSSSPRGASEISAGANDAHRGPRKAPAGEKKQLYNREAAAATAGATADNKLNALTNQKHSARDCEATCSVIAKSRSRHEHLTRTVHDDAPTSPGETLKPASVPIAGFALPPLPRKMDISQQTPTQVNDDRDYNEYHDIVVPSSPGAGDTQILANGPRSLNDDDTGVVNFGNLNDLGRPSSQVSEDGGFENTRGNWRLPTDDTSQQHSSNALTPHRPRGTAFETPTLSKNPFASKGSVNAPLAGSQLFGQTQFSSAIKKISPTSSRPSPRVPHHSLSPLVETSPLKNRANVSSPTDICTSSPQRFGDIPGTLSREDDGQTQRAVTPLEGKSTGGELIPESPKSLVDPPKTARITSTVANGPRAHYEPMKESQERKSSAGAFISHIGSDSDRDDPVRQNKRRKLAEKKRAKAADELRKVNLSPINEHTSYELSGKKRRKVAQPDLVGTNAEELPTLIEDSQTRAAASSNQTTQSTSAEVIPRDSSNPMTVADVDGDVTMDKNTALGSAEDERIPATSPIGSLQPTATEQLEPQLPQLPEQQEPTGVMSGEAEDTLLPALRTTRRRQQRKKTFFSTSLSAGSTAEPVPDPKTTSSFSGPAPETVVDGAELEDNSVTQKASTPKKLERLPTKPWGHLPPPMNTRSRRSETLPSTPKATRRTTATIPASSSVSVLSTTPILSDKTTPATQNSPGSNKAESVTLPSPRDDFRRSTTRASAASSMSPNPAARATRMSKYEPRLDSGSTDELHHSPSGSAMEKSMIQSRTGKSFRQSLVSSHKTGRLFEGMVFAISFQSSQAKQNERNKLEAKIVQAGGMVLSEGFQDLFESLAIMNGTSPVIDDVDPLRLTKASCESGFTALIADGHSRKAKYMQALALGLPCLAHQWISACLNKNTIVDWEPYILCSGASAVLGNAIRSRSLVPYAAEDAELAEIIQRRPLLLEGERILIVVDSKKARNSAKEPYIFLVKALGPSISRVFTTQQAREALLAHKKAGNPFDWLYVDKGTSTVEAVLAPPSGGSKKRKKTAAFTKMGNMRILDDELVIQSLILGRMVNEDELD